MINFLHTFEPSSVLFRIGPLTIYYYGLFIAIGAMLAIFVASFLAKKYKIEDGVILDLSFWTILFGIVGARTYHVAIHWDYYSGRVLEIPQIWRGGIAIHGAIAAGLAVFWLYSKKKNISFFQLAAVTAPGLILAQAIGRWGNYFNQELFGRPTNLPWGIPIHSAKRPIEYLSNNYFHPVFLYESLGNLFIFFVLILLHTLFIKKIIKTKSSSFYFLILSLYLILYSVLRFFMEFIRIDPTPTIVGFRLPQLVSVFILVSLAPLLLVFRRGLEKNK